MSLDLRDFSGETGGWTIEAMLRFADANPDAVLELQEGAILILPVPDAGHQKTISDLVQWFAAHEALDHLAPSFLVKVAAETFRRPDIVLLREGSRYPGDARWVEAKDVLLAIEVVSITRGSLDRILKPVEYERAGIPNFWRVEPAGVSPIVFMHHNQLGYRMVGSIPLPLLLERPLTDTSPPLAT